MLLKKHHESFMSCHFHSLDQQSQWCFTPTELNSCNCAEGPFKKFATASPTNQP